MKLRKLISCLILMMISLSGCAPLEHLDELSVMGAYSREKDAQTRQVGDTNVHYDALLKVISQGHIEDYKDKSSWLSVFGEPILKKAMPDGSEEWLYRYAILSSAKDKVYVYFDRRAQLVKWEKVPCPSFF